MNCNHVQELLPLYVGGDLEEKRVKLVATHLQSCAMCAGEAVEYRATRELLQGFSPPTFSEGVYAGIRRRVLSEIGREPTARTLPQLVASLFRPRIRWAIASALLLAVSAFAFYFIANERTDQLQVAASPSPSSNPDNVPPLASTEGDKGADTMTIGNSGSVNHTIPSRRKKSSVAAANRGGSVLVKSPDARSMTATSSMESTNLAQPDTVAARNPATLEKTLRVEMQTKDPNVRIIWFSQQRTKQVSPGKSSKSIQEVRSYV